MRDSGVAILSSPLSLQQMRFTQVGLMTADLKKAQQGVIEAAAATRRAVRRGNGPAPPACVPLRVVHALCVCVLLQAESEMEKLERQALEEANAHGQAHEPADIDGSARPGAAPALNPEEVRPCVRVCAGTATASRASTRVLRGGRVPAQRWRRESPAVL
jgi:hypothetical protein